MRAPWRLPWLLPALLALATAAAQEPRTDQEVTPERITDHGYLFQLDCPRGWRLLAQADAGQLVPDAVAGCTRPSDPLHAALIVEHVPGTQAGPLAKLLLERMQLEDKETESFVELTWQGQPAVRFVVRGRTGGLPVRYAGTVVVHLDHAYELLGWGPLQVLDPGAAALNPVWDAFRFLPGEQVPGRDAGAGVEELTGVGWRVRGGRFRSAVHGLQVSRPPAGWRLVVGDELRQLNDSAEVGLTCARPELYLVVVPDPIAGPEAAALESSLREQMQLDLGAPTGELTRQVGGQPVRFTLHQAQGELPTTYAHGVFRRGQRLFQVLAWWQTSAGDQGPTALSQGLGLLGFLSDEQRAELTRELERGDDPQNQVGRAWSLRRGVYRDFALGFTWTAPGGFWRLQAGQAARAVNPDARLTLEEPDAGLSAQVIAEEAEGQLPDADALHLAALQAVLGPGQPTQEPLRRQVGQAEFRATWLDLVQGGIELRYLVASAKVGQRVFQLHAWGLPANVKANEERVWAMLDGLQISDRLSPRTTQGEVLDDVRLGIHLDPPGEGWTLRPLTQPQLEASGAGYQWLRDDQGLTLIGVCSSAPEQDAAWFEGFLSQVLLRRLAERQQIRFGAPHPMQVAGRPGQLRQGREQGGGGRVDLLTFHRDRTFYALLVSDERGNGVRLEQVVAGLKLLD